MTKSSSYLLKSFLLTTLISCSFQMNTWGQCTPPASVSATAISCDSVNVNWPVVAGVTGYIYAVNQTANYMGAGLAATTNTGKQGGLYPGTRYYVHVRSNCGTSVSGWARDSFTTPNCAPGTCLAPNAPTAGAISNNSISYSWSSFPGALGYEYVVDQASGSPSGSGTFTTATSITASPLLSGNLYYLHVRTKCSATSFSPWKSTTASRTTGADPNCPTPGPMSTLFLRCDTMSVSWPVAATHTGYLYSFAPASNVQPGVSIGMTNNIGRGNLNASTLYYVQVMANCSLGRSAIRIDSFTTPGCGSNTCLPPASVTTNSITSTTLSISWPAVTGAIGYEVLLSLNATTPTANGNAVTGTTASASNLTPNTTYYLHLRSKCSATVFSAWKTPTRIVTPASTSIGSTPSSNDPLISVYPSPAGQSINVD